MSQNATTPLLNHMYTRFREVFGTPNTMLELDSQWTLRPDSDPRAPALFLMVNGSYEKPAVWLFDPYDGGENVWRTAVEFESDVDKIIKIIQDRVAAASRAWLNGSRDGDGHIGQRVGHIDQRDGHNGGQRDGLADGHDGHMDGRVDGHMDGHVDGLKDRHVDGHMDGHRDGHAHRKPGSAKRSSDTPSQKDSGSSS